MWCVQTWATEVNVLVLVIRVASQTPGVIGQSKQVLQPCRVCYGPVQTLDPLLALLECCKVASVKNKNNVKSKNIVRLSIASCIINGLLWAEKNETIKSFSMELPWCLRCMWRSPYLTTLESLQMMCSWNMSLLSTLSISLRGTCRGRQRARMIKQMLRHQGRRHSTSEKRSPPSGLVQTESGLSKRTASTSLDFWFQCVE